AAGPTVTTEAESNVSSDAIFNCAGAVPAPAQKRMCRPSGRKCGQRCDVSRGVSTTVIGAGEPPAAATLRNGSLIPDANTITPSRFQVAPRPAGASQTTTGASPVILIFLSLPAAKKPID